MIPPADSSNIWSAIWSQKVLQPKIQTFQWRLNAGCLPVRAQLARFITSISNICPLCSNAEECPLHLFFECDIVKQVWFQARFQFDPGIFSHRSLNEAWMQCFTSLRSTDWKALFCYVMWCIWLHRNNTIFNSK